jgi:hypothetical protein
MVKRMEMIQNDTKRLAALELVIERGAMTFFEVGAALKEIRDRDLHRGTHKSFEAYCQERWGLVRQEAYRRIGCASVLQNLSQICDNNTPSLHPANEAQACELASLPPEKQPRAWQLALKRAGDDPKRVTAKSIKTAGQEVLAAPSREPGDEDDEPAAATLFPDNGRTTTRPSQPVNPPARTETGAQAGNGHDTPTVLDAAGGVVPPKLHAVFAEAKRVDRMLSLHRDIVTEFNKFKSGPAKKFVTQPLEFDLQKLHGGLKFIAPHAVCPYCHANGLACTGCNGDGWVDKTAYDQAPKGKAS